MAAPTIDGHANSGNSFHSTASGSVTLTTANAGDAIIMLVTSESVVATVSSISSPNTTGWTKRSGFNYGSSRNVNMEVWYGFAAAALSAESIAVTLNASIDSCALLVFGVHSANGPYTANPFDKNVSVPATGSHQDFTNFVATTPQVTGITTNDGAPLVIGYEGSTSGTTATAGSGFTIVETTASAFGVHEALAGLETESPGKLTAATLAFGNSTFDWGVIFDALISPSKPLFQTVQIG